MKTSLDLDQYLAAIEPADRDVRRLARERNDMLTKPPGSLGRLEELAASVCGMQRTLEPVINNPTVLIFAADHGVCAEKVNPYPQAVTRQMLSNFLAGGAAINAIAGSVGAGLVLVDVGVLGQRLQGPNLISKRIGPGSNNFCEQPAMSESQALSAIAVGVSCAEDAIRNGSTLLALGEIGIGNTTVASAICSALTGEDPENICGSGTGSDPAQLERKKDAVRRALRLHDAHLADPLSILASLGGFELAAICGACMAGARQRCAVLIDGVIATAAAAIAFKMNARIGDYLIAAHQSPEPGHRVLLQSLHLSPLLQLEMRLGEGTGAALAVPIVRAAVATFRSMATFESAGVDQSSGTGSNA